MPDGFADKLYSIGEGMSGIAESFVTFSEGKIKSGIGNIMGGKGSFDGFIDMLVRLSQKDINGDAIRNALNGFAEGMVEVGKAASSAGTVRSTQARDLGGPTSQPKETNLSQEQANEINKIFMKGGDASNMRDLRKYLRAEGLSMEIAQQVSDLQRKGPTMRPKADGSGEVGSLGMDVRDLVQSRVKTDEQLKAEQIVAKGNATAQQQTNMVDTNADTSAVTVAAAGAQIEASSIGSQAIVNSISEGNTVLAGLLQQIQGEFAKLPGYEG